MKAQDLEKPDARTSTELRRIRKAIACLKAGTSKFLVLIGKSGDGRTMLLFLWIPAFGENDSGAGNQRNKANRLLPSFSY